jgi:hypothetical protein
MTKDFCDRELAVGQVSLVLILLRSYYIWKISNNPTICHRHQLTADHHE